MFKILNINLTDDFQYVIVDMKDIPEEFRDDYIAEEDGTTTVSLHEAYEFEITNYEYFEDLAPDEMRNWLPDSTFYLVYGEKMRGNVCDGYTVVCHTYDTLYRDYDVHQILEGVYEDSKIVRLRESSHDTPMGYTVYIVPMSTTEYHRLFFSPNGISMFDWRNPNLPFDKITNFVKEKMGKEEF